MKVLRTGSRTFLPGNSVLDCTLSATESYFRTMGWMKREKDGEGGREKERGRKRGGMERGKEKERERKEGGREGVSEKE